MKRKLTDHEVVQIEQAASGCVSGTLKEWPDLHRALLAYGIELPSNTHALCLKRICQIIIDNLDPLNDYAQ